MAWKIPVKRISANSERPEGEAAALITEVDEPTLAKARLLIGFWRALQPGGVLVGRDVPSRAVAPVLRNLVIFEPVEGNRDLRIRLAGTALLRRFDREVSGSLISSLYPEDHFDIVLGRALKVIANNAPHVDDVVIRNSERVLQHFETVHLPVHSPDGNALWDMAGYFYFP